MIPYVDVAFLEYIKTLFPDFTVVYAPPESARSILSSAAIAKADQTDAPNPNNSVGIPGLSVWRNGTTERTDVSNLPQGYRGWAMGRFQAGAVDPNINSNNVTVSGTPTPGDVITINVTFSPVVNDQPGPVENYQIHYTVQSSDTSLELLTESLANAINQNDTTKRYVSATFNHTGIQLLSLSDKIATYSYTQGNNTVGLAFGMAALKSLAGMHNRTLARHVKVEYIVTCWAKKHSEIDIMERELWFSDVYQAVDITIPSGTNTIPANTFSCPVLRDGAPNRMYEITPNTGRILWHKAVQRFNVFSIWAKSINIPPIESIVVNYEKIMNGEPFTLDQITITGTDPIS